MLDLANISVEDLEEFSVEDLKKLQKTVVKAIATFDERRKKAALAELEAKAREMGYSLAELTAAKGTVSKSAGIAKYRNPENPEQTWTGKGRRPAWFLAAIEAGKSAEDLAV